MFRHHAARGPWARDFRRALQRDAGAAPSVARAHPWRIFDLEKPGARNRLRRREDSDAAGEASRAAYLGGREDGRDAQAAAAAESNSLLSGVLNRESTKFPG